MLENVRGLLSHDKGNTWKVIQEELKKAQYDIHFKVIDAVHWVPQHRRRIFIVGFDKKQFDTNKVDFFSFPTEPITELKIGSILQKRVKEKYTLKDGVKFWARSDEDAELYKKKISEKLDKLKNLS